MALRGGDGSAGRPGSDPDAAERARPCARALLALATLAACGETTPADLPAAGSPQSRGGSAPPAERSRTPTRLRRLSQAEIENVYADLLGARLALTHGFLPDPRADGYDNDAQALGLSEVTLDELDSAAQRAAAHLARQLAACPLPEEGPTCAEALLRELPLRAWGRPATEEEAARLRALYELGRAPGGPADGARLVAMAVLRSPHFTYRTELGDGVPASGGERVRLTADELAGQLSFLLYGARPDDELIEAARQGSLYDARERERQAARLLATPAARAWQRRTVRAWLGLLDAERIVKDAGRFPEFTPEVNRELARELDFVIDEALAADDFLAALLLPPRALPGPALRALYGDELPPDAPDGEPVAADPARRRGVLTLPATLAMHSTPGETSPILRGLLVRTRLLCQEVSPPPPDLPEAPAPDGRAGTRVRQEQHAASPRCRGCHALIDPLGFAFEHYDSLGRYRASEGDPPLPIDASGVLEGAGAEADGHFADAPGLIERLARSPALRACWARQLWRAAEGRAIEPADEPEVARLAGALDSGRGSWQELLGAYVRRPAFVERLAAGAPGDTP